MDKNGESQNDALEILNRYFLNPAFQFVSFFEWREELIPTLLGIETLLSRYSGKWWKDASPMKK